MRLKISKFLIVCLLTFIVLSPELAVLSMVYEQHIQLVEIRQLNCQLNHINSDKISFEKQNIGIFNIEQACQNSAQDIAFIQIFDTNFLYKFLSQIQLYKVINFLKWFFVLFPISLGVLFFLYDRYLVYRATVFQQQVEKLEKLWRESIEK